MAKKKNFDKDKLREKAVQKFNDKMKYEADKMLKRDEHFQKLKDSKGVDPNKLKKLF